MPNQPGGLSPNQSPFQRGSFARRFGRIPEVHVRDRSALEPHYRKSNPIGWRHDLGFLDVVLDNFGIVAAPQVYGQKWEPLLRTCVDFLRWRWELGKSLVLPGRPWTGDHVNSVRRSAATGEPRALLRLLSDEEEDLTLLSVAEIEYFSLPREEDSRFLLTTGTEELAINWSEFRQRIPHWERLVPFEAIWENLFGADGREIRPSPDWAPPSREFTFGVEMPTDAWLPVTGLQILHPRHATPDLPARVGVDDMDLETYADVLAGRDQGPLGTCVAHALCMGLEVALERSTGMSAGLSFSPGWLHAATGQRDDGRVLSRVADVLRELLPPQESDYPYSEYVQDSFTPTRIEQGRADARRSPQSNRLPVLRGLDVSNVASVKAHLAAGWVVVVTTRFTSGLQDQLRDPFIGTFGLPMLPLPGDRPIGGHAWCLVGYDHVDGATKWKYQGRFVALNSWGWDWCPLSPHGSGTLTLPFSYLAFMGLEAVGIRFRP